MVSYMTADMSIPIDSGRYESIRVYAITMFILYPIGMPLGLFVLLWFHRREIQARTSRKGGKSLAVLSFFFKIFSPKLWYLAVVDLVRRLALSSLLLVAGKSYQLLLALCIQIIFIVTYRELGPYW